MGKVLRVQGRRRSSLGRDLPVIALRTSIHPKSERASADARLLRRPVSRSGLPD